MAAVELGAGRLKKDDKIDPKAGIIFNYKIGDRINKENIIAELYSDSKKSILSVEEKIINMVEISEKKTNPPKLIKRIIR
jgi:thymidine phosphorylase